jgi:hypothetical protein
MSSNTDLLLAEMAIEKYAEAKGLDVETVKKKWLPILQATKEKDPFTKSLTEACAVLGQIKEVSKGLDPETREILGKLSTVAVTKALNPEKESEGDVDEPLIRTIQRIKMLDNAFTDQEKVTEAIAAKVSAEVAAPLATAIDKLNETLETVNTAARTAPPEAMANNPELVALSKAVDGINSKLESLTEEVKAGKPAGEVEDDVERMVERINAATEKSKSFLENRGFKITPGESPASFDEARKLVESSGYTLQDQRVTRDEAKKMAEQAAEAERKKHDVDMELKLEEKKIEAAKEVTKAAIDQVMKPFAYFIERFLNTNVTPENVPVPPGAGTPPATTPGTTPPGTPASTEIAKVKPPQA